MYENAMRIGGNSKRLAFTTSPVKQCSLIRGLTW